MNPKGVLGACRTEPGVVSPAPEVEGVAKGDCKRVDDDPLFGAAVASPSGMEVGSGLSEVTCPVGAASTCSSLPKLLRLLTVKQSRLVFPGKASSDVAERLGTLGVVLAKDDRGVWSFPASVE
jgi:hypothetical protein